VSPYRGTTPTAACTEPSSVWDSDHRSSSDREPRESRSWVSTFGGHRRGDHGRSVLLMRKPQGTKFSAPVTIEARSDGWVNRDEITSSGRKKQT
jgi:hypothetical protein